MKTIIAILVAALSILDQQSPQAQDTLHVLFVGNSYTYTNDLPSLFTNLAASDYHPVVTDMSAPGGYTLAQHTADSTTLSKIERGTWDYVVLQEQSQYPTIPYYRENSFDPAARILDSIIVAQGERTAFFMTWGRKRGGQQIINGHVSYPFANFFQMQDTLAAAYTDISDELTATLCPVGLAWSQAVTLHPLEDLWQSDDSHPTLQGSYLAACSFYATFFQANPMGLSYTAGLSQTEAAFLQSSAWMVNATAGAFPPPGPNTTAMKVSPCPSNSLIIITYQLQREGFVSLQVFDTSGRSVATLVEGRKLAGGHEATFNGSKLASGLYFVRMEATEGPFGAGEFTLLQKIVLLK